MTLPIAQVVFNLPVEGPFDYFIPEDLHEKAIPGSRVLVRFASQKRVGVIVNRLKESQHPGSLSTLISVLDAAPVFSSSFLELADDISARFACTKGEALSLFLPSYLRGNKKCDVPLLPSSFGTSNIELLFDHGQTKRWDVLLPRIRQTLDAGKGVLVLVPESSRCSLVLPKLGTLVDASQRVFLSQGTEKEEYLRWLVVRQGKARLVAGFISAVFAPVKNLGLMIMMDEESPFYRCDQSPFYHAREAALVRAKREGFDLMFVSSAPSLELWHQVVSGQITLTRLEEALCGVKLLDLSNFKMRKGTSLSPGLKNQMEAMMKDNKKVLLYVQASRGVTAVMDEVKEHFAGAKVAGYDKASGALPMAFDVLVATQAVFRHRLDAVFHLSAVLDIDWEFHKHDYQALHHAFSLVTHIRQMTSGHVCLQTRHAADTSLHAISAKNPDDFYTHELKLRSEMGLPPFMGMVTIVLRSADEALACAQAKSLYDIFMLKDLNDTTVLEPQKDRAALVRGKFRFCLTLYGPSIQALVLQVKETLKMFHPKKDTIVTVSVA